LVPGDGAPTLAFRGGWFRPLRLAFDEGGSLLAEEVAGEARGIVLPGFVNAHSHAFQRVLRGHVEDRGGDFWAWRERMYHAALELDPDDVRIASRAAFLEMLRAGFTGVAEFHYLHHDSSGKPYADASELARAVLEAAAEVGIRICLLETAYARAGAGAALDPAQRRFADSSPADFLKRAGDLRGRIESGAWPLASFGVALHSVRALPREWLAEIGRWAVRLDATLHMHVAEQPAEVEACLAEHGRRPVELVDELGLLSRRFTAVHAIHVSEGEIGLLGRSGAGVCACPSTEGNLGDGFVRAARFIQARIPLCFGTDSHASIDPFPEMRETEYRERLRSGTRRGAAGAAQLLEAATAGGARRVGWAPDEGAAGGERKTPVGRLETGFAADLVVIEEGDPALAGADPGSLAGHLVFGGSPRLVRDVYVAGRRVIESGRHAREETIAEEFRKLQTRLWGGR
jgi:formimidoylglutamate deiminase